MKARDIMTSHPDVITTEDSISTAARRMRELDVGALPVVENPESMRLVGIVTDRDLVVRHVAEGHVSDHSVRRHMTPRLEPSRFLTVRPEDTVDYLMELMSRGQVRRIPVVEGGDERLVGIVALADVAREVGPEEAARVVEVLRQISEPSRDLTPAPSG